MSTDPPRGRASRYPRLPASRTLADRAYARLRDSIVTLRLAPGAPLTEVELCRRLDISRTPVRTALLRLQQEGLVEATGATRSGRMSVAPLTSADMRELFLMVGALDGIAARLAAELPEAPRRAVADAAEAVNAQLRALSGTDVADIRSAQELDLRFHRCYEQAAAGPRLLAKLGALHARRERYVRVYTEALIQTHSVQASLDEHGAIVAAIAQGDADAAERHAVFNYRNALERYRRIVAIHGERGSWG
jgi:GntR family transcriptional regulator, vanillate catabolism transcriptional regulator